MDAPSFKQPSAFAPLAMSLTALVLLFTHVAIYGIVHEADEGTAARIFQLLLVAQLPIAAFFAIKWLPRSPKRTLTILAIQAAAGVAAIGAVLMLESSG